MSGISPGVYTKIIDLSSYVANVPGTIGFIPFISDRGPDNELIATNGSDFYTDFGEPNILYGGKQYGEGKYVASSFLRESDSLYVIRCLPETAEYSNLAIQYTATDSDLSVDGSLAIAHLSSMNTENEISTALVDDNADGNCIVFRGIARGEWYNNFQIDISVPSNPLSDNHYVIDIKMKQSDVDDDGNDQYEIIESYDVSFDYRDLDTSGESMYVVDVINRYSTYIRCEANDDMLIDALADTANLDFSAPFIADGALVNLDEGSSGELFDENGKLDADIAKQILSKAYLGTLVKPNGEILNDVLDTDNIYFTIVLDGGYPTDVKTQIDVLTKTRGDCIGLIDNGDNSNASTALATRTGENAVHTYNSKYLALYESYSQIYDSYTGRDIWVTPIYHMANIVPYTDRVTELWYAAAGFNRATISSIKKLRYSPLLGERDNFHLNQINSIVKFNVGYTVWGQKTTQKRSSALQDLNIVRLLLYCKRALEQFCKFYIYEQNDSETWSQVAVEVNKFLKQIQNKRGLYSFSVEVGANDYEKKAKIFHVNVTLEPTRVVEKIDLNFFIK